MIKNVGAAAMAALALGFLWVNLRSLALLTVTVMLGVWALGDGRARPTDAVTDSVG